MLSVDEVNELRRLQKQMRELHNTAQQLQGAMKYILSKVPEDRRQEVLKRSVMDEPAVAAAAAAS